jgi:CheY-like chemotaxis protein
MTTPFDCCRPEPTASPILLVEDEAMDIDLTLQAFADARIANQVVVCRDGEGAIAYIDAHGAQSDARLPAVVLLDLHLPTVDGFEVLAHIRRHPVWRRIPVVVLTSSRECQDIARAYELGANSYIVKPMSFEAFAKVVAHIKAYWLLINEPPFTEPTPRQP